MAETSAASSTTMATNEKEHRGEPRPSHDASSAYLEPITSKTEANILPETADESNALDLEKAFEVDKASKPPGATDPSAFPDGGLQAWLVVFGAFLCLFVSFGWINCIGVFQDYYQSTLLSQYSPSTVSWIPSLETFMMFAGGPVFGKLYDSYGPRYLLLAGSFLHVFGLMMTSLSTQYWHFILAQGICSPLGASAIFYPALSSLSTWFFHRRAFAFGIAASGSSLGGVIFPILVQQLIPKIGFPWTMRVAAFLILGLLLLANLTVRSRLPPSPKPFRLVDFILPLRELPFALIVAASSLVFFGLFLPFNFIIIQATAAGMDANLASYLLAIINAASVLGRTLPGWVADKYGRFNMTVVMVLFSGIIVLALWLPSRANAPIIVFAALYGFGSGAFVSLAPALVAQISDVRQIGVRTGTLFAIVSVAALCGNPIGGALLAKGGGTDYSSLQIFSGVMLSAGGAMFLVTRWSLVGMKVRVKV